MTIRQILSRRFTYMKNRCYCVTNTNYFRYGAIGITICEEWLNNKESFIQWSLENGFSPELTIDRIDGTKAYSPNNCRWATPLVQAQNTKRLHSTNKSGYRGVSWQKKLGKWEVSIKVNNQIYKLGYYQDALEAARVYDSYVLDNQFNHTLNGVIHSIKDKRNPNTGQTLIESNTSGYAGVVYVKRIQKWYASVEYQGKKHSLKYHNSALKAAIVRDIFIINSNLVERRIKRNFPDKTLEELQSEASY